MVSASQKRCAARSSVTTSDARRLPSEIQIPLEGITASSPQSHHDHPASPPSPDTLPHPLPFSYLIIPERTAFFPGFKPFLTLSPLLGVSSLPFSTRPAPTHPLKVQLRQNLPLLQPRHCPGSWLELPSLKLLTLHPELCRNTNQATLCSLSLRLSVFPTASQASRAGTTGLSTVLGKWNEHRTTALPGTSDVTTSRRPGAHFPGQATADSCQTGRSEVHLNQKVLPGNLPSLSAPWPQDPEQPVAGPRVSQGLHGPVCQTKDRTSPPLKNPFCSNSLLRS